MELKRLAIIFIPALIIIGYFLFHSIRRFQKNERSKRPDFEDFGGKEYLGREQWAHKFDLEHCAEEYKKKNLGILITAKGAKKEGNAFGFILSQNAFKKYYSFDLYYYRKSRPSVFLRDAITDIFHFILPQRILPNFSKDILSDILKEETYPRKYIKALERLGDKCRSENIGIFLANINEAPHLYDKIIDLLNYSSNLVCFSEEYSDSIDKLIRTDRHVENGIRLIYQYTVPPLNYFSYVFRLSNNLPASGIDYLGNSCIKMDESYIDYKSNSELFKDFLLETQKPFYSHAYLLSNGRVEWTKSLNLFEEAQKSSSKNGKRLIDNSTYFNQTYSKYKDTLESKLTEEEKKLIMICSIVPFSLCEKQFCLLCKETGVLSPPDLKNKLLSCELLYETNPYQYINIFIEMEAVMENGIIDDGYFDRNRVQLLFANNSNWAQMYEGVKKVLSNTSFATVGLNSILKAASQHRFVSVKGYYVPEVVRNILIHEFYENINENAYEIILSAFKSNRSICGITGIDYNLIKYVYEKRFNDLFDDDIFANSYDKNALRDDNIKKQYISIFFNRRYAGQLTLEHYLDNFMVCMSHLAGKTTIQSILYDSIGQGRSAKLFGVANSL